MNPTDDILSIKGVGEKTARLFRKIGIDTVEDLIHDYPRDYVVYPEPTKLKAAQDGEMIAVFLQLQETFSFKKFRNLTIGTGKAADGQDTVALTFFNMPYLKSRLVSGACYLFYGKLQKEHGQYRMEQPVIYSRDEYEKLRMQLQPVYGLTKGMTNQLPDRKEALKRIHFPENYEELAEGRRRLVFDELFLFLLMIRKMKQIKEEDTMYSMLETAWPGRLIEQLPYPLTGAQKRVYGEIVEDLTGGRCMNRLIQGDVGSGKTILAFLALLLCVDNGYQGALMAPTEILATQHFEQICAMTKKYELPFKPVLLTGSMTAKAKKESYQQIADGSVNLVIGTHALIQDKVSFQKLALVITDEQHRFGVRQRERFGEKGGSPHVLVMSATPIPRTLAIILYGDLHISLVDERPAERLPVKNCVVGVSYRPKAYAFIEKEVAFGRQVYVICPMVEENEALHDVENVTDYTRLLREKLNPKIRVEMIHGKMKADQKQEIMDQFAKGNIDVLVSTTVIEVGINVPNATVMLVENAERFGLAQLHQLRGRIGRGKEQSYCIFMNHSEKPENNKRLKILNDSNDGFYIAEQDLKLRGPGDLFGIRQSGLMEFKIADVYQDASLLKKISQTVDHLLAEDENLTQSENSALREYLEENTTKLIDFKSI